MVCLFFTDFRKIRFYIFQDISFIIATDYVVARRALPLHVAKVPKDLV
ncbi:MAG: hypothetical protein L3J17_12685 [Candidatus Jettenia sp.]|nr:MAG: hypothetical protein L3J17_12685 [Candidatus Jettenia sp.]